MKKYSPIVLFVYSRLEHTKKTINALLANDLAEESDLIVYSDGAKNEDEAAKVNDIRQLLKSVRGFHTTTVIERDSNYGLARNIIEGVTDVCQRYGRAIVLEDDILTAPNFLIYMNAALDYYETEKKVWHISGWNYPIDSSELGDAFFLRVMNCWGWATWNDRWVHFEKNTDQLIADFNRTQIRAFDLNHSGVFWSQVLNNKRKRINTWAVYWYATIFRKGGLCLNPSISYVDNIGFDGSGTHGTINDLVHSVSKLSTNLTPVFPDNVVENVIGIKRIISYYDKLKPTFIQKIVEKFHSVLRRVRLK